MFLRLALFALLSSATAWAGRPSLCEPAAEIRAELEKAAALLGADPAAFEQNVAPFQALRERHPGDPFVHERYQDAVQQYGIEGHLRQLTEEYQNLALEHAGDLMYRYLFARSVIGRGTVSALQYLNGILAERPDFAPAHRALAEIYDSETFHDVEKEKIEREKLFSLCPGAVVARRPAPLPEPSPLLEHAEKLFLQNGEPSRVAATALEGLRADEWRLQRIRPFEWYSAEYKRQSQRELRAEYWRVWSLQVRCYRKARQLKEAADLLRVMEQRATLAASSDPSYWDALATLALLYAEAGQKTQAAQKLDGLQQFLARHSDNNHAAQLEDLRKLIAASGEPTVRTESGSLARSSER